MKQSLKKSVMKGVAWTGVSRFITQAIQFIVTIVLARLLFPKDFGVIGMATIFIQLANTINQLGLASAIIQKKDIDDKHLSSVFWANIFVSVILCCITILISGWIASFFRNDLVKPVLIALSLMFIIGSFRGVQYALLTKDLKFNTLAFINIGEMLSNGIVSILLAILKFGVWSLVWGRLFGIFVGLILTWCATSWRPKFVFIFSKFKELFRFGANVMGTNILTYAGQNVDYLIVGRFLGTAPLGIYTMAYNLVTLPQRKFSSIITQVAFPAFSKIQDNNARIAKNYLKMLTYISVITFPLLSGLMITAPEFVNIVLGKKWLSVIIPVQIMCISGMIKSVGTTVGSLFYALGRPDLELKLDVLFVVLIIPLLFIGIRWGITGIAIVVTIHSVIAWIFLFANVAKLIKTKFTKFIKILFPAFYLSVTTVVSIIIYKYIFLLYFQNKVILFPSSICLAVVLYFLQIKMVSKDAYEEIFIPFFKKIGNLF